MNEDNSPLVLETHNLTKRYGKRRALADCSLRIPKGRVIGLVGPNGAGKSTLLQLATGLITPSSGEISVLGSIPGATAAHLAKVGFVAQDAPTYAGLTVAEHLRLGARLNPTWDADLAKRRITEVDLNPRQKAGRLSGGQRAQLALTIAAAKRPELLLLDEPAAALDPLARAGFLQNLVEFVAELGASAVLSSHLLADVERICDFLVVLCESRVQVAGEVSDLLAMHRRVRAPESALDRLPSSVAIVHAERSGKEVTAVVRAGATPLPGTVERVRLEDLVLSYMTRAANAPAGTAAAVGGAPR